MFKLSIRYSIIVLLFALLAVGFVACDKTEFETTFPSDIILKSEQLAIPAAVALPENLPSGNSRIATYYAHGVQRYKAQEKQGAPGTFEWVFVAPVADLYGMNNLKVGTHSAGPSWQLPTLDTIFAQHFEPQRTAPSPDPNAIPWLLLKPKDGKVPTGAFVQVSYIQRIATKGGKAPATPPTSVTELADVPYTAVYRFSKKNQ